MKSNKNIFTLSLCLAMSCPFTASQPTQDDVTKHNDLEGITVIEITQTITSDDHIICNKSVHHEISQDAACDLIKEFSDNLGAGQKFTIHNASFIVDTTKKLTPAQESVIQEIASELIETAVSSIANAIEAAHTTAVSTPVSQQAAVVLLQQFTNNLEVGNNFVLNGVNYTVQAPSKIAEISEENK